MRRLTTRWPTRRRLAAAARDLGWPAAAASAVSAAALLLSLVELPREARELDAAQAAARRTRDLALGLLHARSVERAEAAPDERFRSSFPAADERGRRVAALLATAAKLGVAPRRSEYRVTVERELGIAVYRIGLPASGSYAALRGFVETALRDDPALALDSLRLRRAQPASAEVQADLQFSMLMNAGGEFTRTAALGRP